MKTASSRRAAPQLVKRSGPGVQQPGFKLLALLSLCAVPGYAVLILCLRDGVAWVAIMYGVISLLTFLLYRHDKRKAASGGWRVPEKWLHAGELLGGWPGALLAQQFYRHKTRKLSFQLVFWLIVVVHQLIWIDWLWFGGQLARVI